MIFTPENFRTFDAKTPSPSIEIRTRDGSPMILIKSTGEAAYAGTRLEKDQLVARFDDEYDLLLWAWQGQYRTDVFRLTRADLDRCYIKKKKAASASR